MRKTALAGAAVLTATLLLTGCGADDGGSGDAMSDQTASSQEQSEDMGEDMSAEPDDMADDMAARTGTFEGLNDKSVAGTVEVSGTELVLSGYSSDEGPDLHVYLTNGTDEAAVAAGTEIDVVAFDEASQTFALDGVDVAGYDTVVIHCDKAKAVFGAASLA
jgi:hypothetical protein